MRRASTDISIMAFHPQTEGQDFLVGGGHILLWITSKTILETHCKGTKETDHATLSHSLARRSAPGSS